MAHYTLSRYADILVHRLLDASLRAGKENFNDRQNSAKIHSKELIEGGREGKIEAFQKLDELKSNSLLPEDELKLVGRHLNDKKEAAKKAQESSERLFLCLLLRKHPVKTKGLIHFIGERCLRVLIPLCGVDKTVCLILFSVDSTQKTLLCRCFSTK